MAGRIFRVRLGVADSSDLYSPSFFDLSKTNLPLSVYGRNPDLDTVQLEISAVPTPGILSDWVSVASSAAAVFKLDVPTDAAAKFMRVRVSAGTGANLTCTIVGRQVERYQ